MLGKYTIGVTMVFARDFPLNIKPARSIATDNLMLKGVAANAAKYDSRAESNAGASAAEASVTPIRSTAMEESAARILASSRDNNPQTRAAA